MPPLPIAILVAAVVAVVLAFVAVAARRGRHQAEAKRAAEAVVPQLTEDDIAWRIGASDRPTQAAEAARVATAAAVAAAQFAAAAEAAARAFAAAEHETAGDRGTDAQGTEPTASVPAVGVAEPAGVASERAAEDELPVAAAVAIAPDVEPPARPDAERAAAVAAAVAAAPTTRRRVAGSSRYRLWRDSAAVLLIACLAILAMMNVSPSLFGVASATQAPTQAPSQLAAVTTASPPDAPPATLPLTAGSPTVTDSPSPSPSPAPTPTLVPSPSPSPTPRPTARPTATPRPTPPPTPRPTPAPKVVTNASISAPNCSALPGSIKYTAITSGSTISIKSIVWYAPTLSDGSSVVLPIPSRNLDVVLSVTFANGSTVTRTTIATPTTCP